jgi:hypothetical protein
MFDKYYFIKKYFLVSVLVSSPSFSYYYNK